MKKYLYIKYNTSYIFVYIQVLLCSCQLFVVDNCVDDWRIAVSLRGVLLIGAELLVCSVHPVPGSYYFRWMSMSSRSPAVRHRLDDHIIHYHHHHHHHQLLQAATDVDHHPDVSAGGTFQTYIDSAVELDEDEGSSGVARVPFDVLLSLPMFLRLYLVGRGIKVNYSVLIVCILRGKGDEKM